MRHTAATLAGLLLAAPMTGSIPSIETQERSLREYARFSAVASLDEYLRAPVTREELDRVSTSSGAGMVGYPVNNIAYAVLASPDRNGEYLLVHMPIVKGKPDEESFLETYFTVDDAGMHLQRVYSLNPESGRTQINFGPSAIAKSEIILGGILKAITLYTDDTYPGSDRHMATDAILGESQRIFYMTLVHAGAISPAFTGESTTPQSK